MTSQTKSPSQILAQLIRYSLEGEAKYYLDDKKFIEVKSIQEVYFYYYDDGSNNEFAWQDITAMQALMLIGKDLKW